jgi:hypothetical protein
LLPVCSAIARAAGTTAQPGCVPDAAWESSVSSAWAEVPLASAASVAEVSSELPTTCATGGPPSLLTYRRMTSPGFSREPEIMAAKVSRTCCLARPTTSSVSDRVEAAAMYPDRVWVISDVVVKVLVFVLVFGLAPCSRVRIRLTQPCKPVSTITASNRAN